jgi:uncharacterized protein YeaO (DUF488 family)
MSIRIKRVYDPPDPADGVRVLVDRLWPRGLAKAKAQVDLWLKDVAPSDELRHWFNHDPRKWREFRSHYFRELKQHGDDLSALKKQAGRKRLTLLYAARDEAHNNAVALKDFLEKG